MKTKKINHSEILNSLKAEYITMTREREAARKAWLASRDDKTESHKLYEVYHSNDETIENLEREIKFHTVMLQEKKYATLWLFSDAHAYEIIEEKSDKVILVRQLKATIKPEAQKALHDSFVPGGFCGHFNNDAQEWDFATDESNPIETIRKHKNGRWYGLGKARFTIEAEPYERFDYNF